ncbi:hypothetical protein [Parasedimentitalea maritima]|uniref:Uncharacterized protein n=1 Tax=Parasedimentitalea maritima TaxID=2578117 RepID=A0A6A4RL80_9RHOB|nr:hypothetical protein [Zongyanglinia marina]KAE9630544.1 hypothetical protein GP644_09090 [Zongyanglinia marina]
MPDDIQTLERKVQSIEKTLEAKLKANKQEDAKRAAKIESQADQSAQNVQTLVKKFTEIDSHLKTNDSQIKANTQDTEGNRQALIRARKYVDTAVQGIGSQVKANAHEAEENRQALVRARKYVDDHDTTLEKKITELKKLISEMEKRHVKLVATQIKNYDKLIRKVISQEVAKVAKGKR